MADKWEVCYVRPTGSTGSEVTVFHPEYKETVQYSYIKDFMKKAGIKPVEMMGDFNTVVSWLLSGGWEPMMINAKARGDHIQNSSCIEAMAFRRKVG